MKEYEANFKPPGKQPGCQASQLMWQPKSCTLPLSAKAVAAKPRRTLFIGD